ncbi:hypothetical protein BCR32DRAFT_275585 [Anaeromyces robustus]|uniref:Ankyrin n=1 Tax=Anaeromyces robustus TaxID=1754192 RepID=A0A1Y1XLH4_9FUNG|nr:hypothetical protein BCR32DRAFT_275585 [Anaeromyces robustus]|eukprot:ORX86194.1 hypothetical protein BCR32DRAFT_275585 [Anaeromyces robustus]
MNNRQKGDKEFEIIKESVCKIIKDNDIELFDHYINSNEIDINHLSYENAILNNKFGIADLLLENNANIENEMSTLLLIKNCNNREEEEDKVFDIFWKVYLNKINDIYGLRMFNNLEVGNIRLKEEVVDKHIKDITLKNKIHRYIDNKLIPKEKQIIRKNEIEKIKNMNMNTVHDIVSKCSGLDNFDPLIIAIENNISNNIIIEIMNQYHIINKSFNYFIKKEYYKDGYSLKSNIITYNRINIIKYLYFENYLNPENFQYILSRKLIDDDKRERDYIIEKWIEASENIFLELHIKALNCENYNAILILYNYDKNGDYNIFKLISINKEYNKDKMLELLSKCEIKNNFKDENFYNSKFINEMNSIEFKNSKNNITEATENNINNYCDIDTNYNDYWFNNKLYISKLYESTYESIKSKIIELNILYESWNPEKDLPNKENIEEFKEYIIKNKEIIIKFNKVSYNFDLLIYTIENNYPLEIIDFIINNFNYKSLDYGLEGKNIYSKTPKYRTPLFEALSKENFELADYLLIWVQL